MLLPFGFIRWLNASFHALALLMTLKLVLIHPGALCILD